MHAADIMQAMSKLLLNLRHVGEDEYHEVCAVLDRHGIAWYRTEPSPWGISNGGLWVRDDADHPAARQAMAGYQQQRSERMRAARARALRDGSGETFAGLVRRRPLYVLAMLLAMLAVASLVLLPFLLLRG